MSINSSGQNESAVSMEPEAVKVVLKYIENHSQLYTLTDQELSLLPSEVFDIYPPTDIDIVWKKLPQQLKLNKFRRCTDHWNKGRTHIDGPPPMLYKCPACN